MIINNDKVEKELSGIIQDNIIRFIDKPYKTTFNYNTNTLINESDETRLEILFHEKETKSNYLLKNYNQETSFNIVTNKILKNNYNIDIEYKMLDTNEEFKYRIEVIE